MWFAHVYETVQDPNQATNFNAVGRWHWGPWFWPSFPAMYALPSGSYGDVTTTPENWMDTSLVNGVAYPTLTVDRANQLIASASDTSASSLEKSVEATLRLLTGPVAPANIATGPSGTRARASRGRPAGGAPATAASSLKGRCAPASTWSAKPRSWKQVRSSSPFSRTYR